MKRILIANVLAPFRLPIRMHCILICAKSPKRRSPGKSLLRRSSLPLAGRVTASETHPLGFSVQSGYATALNSVRFPAPLWPAIAAVGALR